MKKPVPHDLPYRDCVGIALFNYEGRVFVGERIDTPGAWQMPQGGIDPGESIEEAVFRELEEEVGTINATILRISDLKTRYDLPEYLLHKLWEGKYRGQEQTWVAMRFEGQESEIDIEYFSEPEFRDWKWAKLSDLLDLIVPFKRDTYQKIIKEFREFGV